MIAGFFYLDYAYWITLILLVFLTYRPFKNLDMCRVLYNNYSTCTSIAPSRYLLRRRITAELVDIAPALQVQKKTDTKR